jgi:non-ribosomal peptide synthetase component E (peptide arylation enzyme)
VRRAAGEVQAAAAIEVLDQLPKNAVGKIDKPELRRRAAA